MSALEVTACTADVVGLPPRALYVEETVLGTPDGPRRQRVFVLEPGDATGSDGAVADVRRGQPGCGAVDACRGGGHPRFARDEVRERPGCAVLAALGRERLSRRDHRAELPEHAGRRHLGAATRRWSTRSGFRLWEQAFDASGQPVGKADVGTYVFVRRSPVVTR